MSVGHRDYYHHHFIFINSGALEGRGQEIGKGTSKGRSVEGNDLGNDSPGSLILRACGANRGEEGRQLHPGWEPRGQESLSAASPSSACPLLAQSHTPLSPTREHKVNLCAVTF